MTISPCVKICALDAASGLCRGCGRTIEEITRWSTMTETERNRIMHELPGRRETGKASAAKTLNKALKR